jgi:hypothetical protein
MKKHWKAIAAILGVFALLGWFALDLMQDRAAMTAGASAVVVAAQFDEDEESSSLDETDIEYRFEAGGAPVQAISSLPGDRLADYPPGRTIAICYDPQEPTSSRINTDGSACSGAT